MPGGHAHTHDVLTAGGCTMPVDTGFIVHNQRTYPLLTRLFRELGVASHPTEMSLSVRCEGCGLEYAGARGLTGLFAQPCSAANPAFLRMLIEVRRFHRRARSVLAQASDELTLHDFLLAGRLPRLLHSPLHGAHGLLGLVGVTRDRVAYPARYLFAFLDNHGMLSVTGSPEWRTVTGGSRTYVEKAVKHLSAVATATPVRAVVRHADGVEIRDDSDQAILFVSGGRRHPRRHRPAAAGRSHRPAACHAGCLRLLPKRDLAAHRRPRRSRPRPAPGRRGNHLLPSCHAGPDRVLVSYDMNRLQALATRTPHLCHQRHRSDRPRPGAGPHDLRTSDLHDTVRRRPTAPARAQRRDDRVRRRLPRLGLPRGRLPGRDGRGESLGVAW